MLLALTPACKKGTEVPQDTEDPGPMIIEHCGEIDGDELWEATATHILTCDVTVSGTLELEPGVEVYADRDTALIIAGGSLLALGESDAGILLASNEGFPLAGDWVGLVGQDADLQLSWVTLRHAGVDGGLIELEGGTASLQQIILSNGISTGLSATGTAFEAITAIEIAYVPTPLELPWTAAQVLSAVSFQEVGTESIIFPETTLSEEATLPEQEVPYLSSGLTIQGGGSLDVGAGALLQMGGDIVVEDGSLIAYGDQISGATIEAQDADTGFQILIGAQAETATFRYATINHAVIDSQAAALYFSDNTVSGAMGTGLVVAGGIKDDDPGSLEDNSFSGTGLGLVVDWDLLPAVGDNDFSGASFDGVAVAGGTSSSDTEISAWPSEQVLLTGDVELTGGTHGLSSGALLFADATGLTVSGGAVTATDMSFDHQSDSSGGWRGVTITGGEVSITGSTVSNGGADDGANITVSTDATITGNTISYSAGWGILVQGDGAPTISDNSYLNNALGDVGP